MGTTGLETTRPNWSFLSNHAHVLLSLAAHPDIRLRDLADRTCLTERTVYAIINDLEAAGYLHRVRRGRRNHYELNAETALHHRLEAGHTLGDLLGLRVAPCARLPAAPPAAAPAAAAPAPMLGS